MIYRQPSHRLAQTLVAWRQLRLGRTSLGRPGRIDQGTDSGQRLHNQCLKGTGPSTDNFKTNPIERQQDLRGPCAENGLNDLRCDLSRHRARQYQIQRGDNHVH